MAKIGERLGRMNHWRCIVLPMPSDCECMHLPSSYPSTSCTRRGSQTRRSSKSVSAQIVEGHALRQYKSEYLHYLGRSYASAEETIEHLQYLLETGSADRVQDECRSLIDEYAVLCRKLFNYMSTVRDEHNPSWMMGPDER